MAKAASWRPVVAALANADLQPVVGRMLLGDTVSEALTGLSASKQRRLLSTLRRSGLVTSGDPDALLNHDIFSELLEQAAEPKREGVRRFLDGERIAQYPANPSERGELLAWVAERVLAPGETVDEATINARLERFSDDTAKLRRYLVDYSLLERRRDGSEYFRPSPPTA